MEQESQQQRPVLPLSTYNESILSSYREEGDDQSILSSYQEEDDGPKNEYPIIMMNVQAEVSSSPTLEQDSTFVQQPVLLPPAITTPSDDETTSIREETSSPQSMALIVFHRQQKDKEDENMQQQAAIIKYEEGAAEQKRDQQQHEVAVHEDMGAQEVEYPSTVVSTIVDDRVTALAGIGWKEMVDPASGHFYYHHLQSGDKQLTNPFLVVKQDGPRSDGTACVLPAVSSIGEAEEPLQQEDQQQKGLPPAEGIATIVDAAPKKASMPIGGNDADGSGVGSPEEEIGWVECFDQITGQRYYLHPITGERRWSHPYLVPSASLEETAGGANVEQDREPKHINVPAVEQIEAIVVEQSVVAEETEAEVEREEAYLEEETKQQHINVPTIGQIQEIFVVEQPALAELQQPVDQEKAEEKGRSLLLQQPEEPEPSHKSETSPQEKQQQQANIDPHSLMQDSIDRERVEVERPPMIQHPKRPGPSGGSESSQQQHFIAKRGLEMEPQPSQQGSSDQEKREIEPLSSVLQQSEEPGQHHGPESSPQEEQQQEDQQQQHLIVQESMEIESQPLLKESTNQEKVEVESPARIQQPDEPQPWHGSESSKKQQQPPPSPILINIEPQPPFEVSLHQGKAEIDAPLSSEEPESSHGPEPAPKEQQQEGQQDKVKQHQEEELQHPTLAIVDVPANSERNKTKELPLHQNAQDQQQQQPSGTDGMESILESRSAQEQQHSFIHPVSERETIVLEQIQELSPDVANPPFQAEAEERRSTDVIQEPMPLLRNGGLTVEKEKEKEEGQVIPEVIMHKQSPEEVREEEHASSSISVGEEEEDLEREESDDGENMNDGFGQDLTECDQDEEPNPRSPWVELYDPVTGQVYYFNAAFNQSDWEPPASLPPPFTSAMSQTSRQQQQQQHGAHDYSSYLDQPTSCEQTSSLTNRYAKQKSYYYDNDDDYSSPPQAAAYLSYNVYANAAAVDEEEGVIDQYVVPPPQSVGGEEGGGQERGKREESDEDRRRAVALEENGKEVEVERLKQAVEVLEQTVGDMMALTGRNGDAADNASVSRLKDLEEAVNGLQTVTRGFLTRTQPTEEASNADMASTMLMRTATGSPDGDSYHAPFQGTMTSSAFLPNKTTAAKRLQRLNDLLDFAVAEDHINLFDQTTQGEGDDGKSNEGPGPEDGAATSAAAMERPHLPFQARIDQRSKQLFQSWKHRRRTFEPDQDSEMEEGHELSQTEKKDEQEIDDEDDNLKEAPQLCLTLPDPLQQGISEAKAYYREMLRKVKEKDRAMNKAIDQERHVSDPSMLHEEQEDSIDYKSLHPDSIILGHRHPNWIQLLEPDRGLIFYQNTETGEFCRKMPGKEALRATQIDKLAGGAIKKAVKSADRPRRPSLALGQKRNNLLSTITLTRDEWIKRRNHLHAQRRASVASRLQTPVASRLQTPVLPAIQSHVSIPQSLAGQDPATSKLSRPPHPPRHPQSSVEKVIAQGLQATFPLADLPATYRRRSSKTVKCPPSTSRPVTAPPIRKQGSNGKESLFSASSDEPIADERRSSVRTASSQQQLTEKEEKALPQQPFRLAGNHKGVIPIFADIFSTIEKEKDEAKRRDQVAGRLDRLNRFFEMQRQQLMSNMPLDSNVASRRQRKLLHQAIRGSHSQQTHHHRCQVRFLDIVLAEILSILGRKLDSRRLLRRQHLLDLVRLQAISTPMAQHEASICEEERGNNAAGVDVFAKLKDLHILRDDGFWLEMQDTNIESGGSSKIYVRDRNGEPAVQPGVPLRHRLLALLNKGSLKQELGDGWEEHFCREGPLVGETTIYFDKVHHKVTWREPKRLFKDKNRSSSSAAEAKESSASAPQQDAAAILNLGRHRSSLLTRGIVSMLREPNPTNQTSLLAVIGFALLALQGILYHQADAALKKAIALMTRVAGEKTGNSKRSIPTARQQAFTLIASSRVALLNDDFGQAANSCSSALAMAKDEVDIITMAAEIFLHLGLEEKAEQALASGLAKVLRDETPSKSSVAFYRLYARYCRGRGCHRSTDIYFKKAIQYGKKKASNSISSSNRSSYREVAQACLEYAVFLLESTQYGESQVSVIKVLEAERLLRQGINLIRTASHSDWNDKREKGLKRSKSTAEQPEHDRDQLSDLYYCLGRLYHIYRQHSHSPQHHSKPSHFQCALGYYSQALKLRPNHPLALLYAACLFSLQKPVPLSTWMKAAASSSLSIQKQTKREEEIREADALFRKALIQPEMKSLGYLPSLLYVHFLAIILCDYAQAEEECLRLMVIQQPKEVSALPGIALAGFLYDHVASGGKAAARQLYRRIAELYPSDAVAQVAMGMSLINDLSSPLNMEEANGYIDRALRISDGTFVPALRAKAILLSKAKDSTGKARTKAHQLFHYGLRLMPTNAPLLRSTAMHLLASMPLTEAQGLQRQAMSLLSKALELGPYHIPTLLACALAKFQCFQDTKGAEDLLMKVIALIKSIPSHQSNTTRHKQYKAHAYRLLGHLYYDSAKNESALSAFSSALRLHKHLEGGQSESSQAMVGYASAMAINALSMNRRDNKRPNYHNDKVDEAKKYFKKAFDSDNHSRPLSSYCYILYGAFQMKVCYDLKAAHDLFLSVAKDKRRPANCLALYYLGRIAMAQNRLKEMEQWFIWALELEPMTHLQVMEYVLMMQELQIDFENESRFYEQIKARHLRTSLTGQSSSLYKEVWQRKWELFSKVMTFARLREQYLITKKGLDLSSFRPSTLLMAEVGWEICYARTMFDQPDTWSGMLTAQIGLPLSCHNSFLAKAIYQRCYPNVHLPKLTWRGDHEGVRRLGLAIGNGGLPSLEVFNLEHYQRWRSTCAWSSNISNIAEQDDEGGGAFQSALLTALFQGGLAKAVSPFLGELILLKEVVPEDFQTLADVLESRRRLCRCIGR